MENLLHVGKDIPRTAEIDKVTGRAVYMDEYRRPGMLYGKILYSQYAHARIKSINTEKAKKLPGVRAVITGYDIPDVRVGFLGDQTVLKRDVVRQYRDEVAAVAAISMEIAQEALQLIEVEYEPLPAIFDPVEAMKPDAPLVHELDARGRPLRSNILPLPWKFSAGDVEKARQESAHIVTDNLTTPWINQCCMGTSGCVAEFDSNNNLTFCSQTNVIFGAKQRIATYLKNIGLKGKKIKCPPAAGVALGLRRVGPAAAGDAPVAERPPFPACELRGALGGLGCTPGPHRRTPSSTASARGGLPAKLGYSGGQGGVPHWGDPFRRPLPGTPGWGASTRGGCRSEPWGSGRRRGVCREGPGRVPSGGV